MKNKSVAKIKKNQEKQGFLSKRNMFCNFCPTTKRPFFFTRPEKKIDTRTSRKGISRNAKNQQKVEETRNKDHAMRKKHETKHRRKEGSKIKDPISSKKLTK